MAAVEVNNLAKSFRVPVRQPGLRASVRSLLKREHRVVPAVQGITFSVDAGEIVGFLGPNGAGKTTTLKMLAGLLHPSAGTASVLGFEPHQRSHDYLRRMALVMGNRNSLQWDLPALDSFELNRAIYQVPEADYRQRRDEFIEILDVGDLVTKPVRNLSLGERMKVEIIGGLLHAPDVLFLDEPTIGLDLTMQKRIRAFVSEYRGRTNAAVLLTSHYMADVVALCERVIVIHRGELLYDGGLQGLADRFGGYRILTVEYNGRAPDVARYGDVVSSEPGRAVFTVPRQDVAAVAARVLADLDVVDVSIEEPPIEDVIEQAFASGPADPP